MTPLELTAMDEAKPRVGPRSWMEKPGSTDARAAKLPSRRRRERSREVIRAPGEARSVPAPAGEIQVPWFRLLEVLDAGAAGYDNRAPSSSSPVSRGGAVW